MKKLIYILLISSFFLTIISCSDSETRMPLAGTATVIINLGLPSEDPSAYDDTIWNRVRRFFVRDAVAQTAPAAFGSIHVRVDGPDIGAIEQSFPPYGTIALSVPAGSLRRFEVTAYVAPGDPSAALSFSGTALANLPAGGTVAVPVLMRLNETKIVVPDYLNSRIVMLNNMSGSGWKVLPGSYAVYDIDFDSRGRIYFTVFSVGGPDAIYRVDNIEGDNIVSTTPGIADITGISVDRKNNKLYCVGGNQIRQSNLDFSSGVTRALTSITGITSCEVQDSENIFITTANSLYHYDWDNNTTEISPLTGLDTAFDVQVRPPYIYVANSQNASGQQVLQLTHDYSSGTFNIVASYGTQTGSTDTNPGMFYGAHRFIAIRNDSLIIADSHDSSEPRLSKLVSFTNMSGLGWATYGEYGTGNGQFKIYNYC